MSAPNTPLPSLGELRVQIDAIGIGVSAGDVEDVAGPHGDSARDSRLGEVGRRLSLIHI